MGKPHGTAAVQEPADEGLRLFPEAAERYSPELFAEWRAAEARLNSRPARRGILVEINATGLVRIDEDASFRQAAAEAKDKVLRDLGDRIQRGDLAAIGEVRDEGVGLFKSDVVPGWWFKWDNWRGRHGERIRFGTRYIVRNLRVHGLADAARLFPELFPDHIARSATPPPQPLPNDNRDGAEAVPPRAHQRRPGVKKRLIEFLESMAREYPDSTQSKRQWMAAAAADVGAPVTENLFNESWRDADLPKDRCGVWKGPGRRVPDPEKNPPETKTLGNS